MTAMSKGDDHVYKRCRCRDENGRELGADCPKLRRANDTWNPRHGSWQFRLELPRGPGGKRRTPLRKGGFAARDDAIAAYEKARDQLRGGGDPSIRTTVGQYLDDWMAGRPDLKRTTRRGYLSNIRLYLRPLIGHLPLADLDSAAIGAMFAQVERWNAELAAGRPVREHQKPCGPATQQRIRATLRAALTDAVVDGKLSYNPATRVRMTPERKSRPAVWTDARTAEFWERLDAWAKDDAPYSRFKAWRHKSLRPARVMVWTPEQTGVFLDSVAGDRLAALFELAADAGMRRGELAGLPLTEVDLDAATVRVSETRVAVGWEVVDETPKSDAGTRPIPISGRTVKALRKFFAQRAKERLAWGGDWTDSGLAFCNEDGSPVHPGILLNHFYRLAYDAGLPPVALHGMRHGSATYLLAGKVDIKVVQERLGHSTSALTRDTYTSVLDEVARAAAEVGESMIPRAGTGTDGHPRGTQPGPDTPGGTQDPVRLSDRRKNPQVRES
jgi:integrase